MRTALVLAISLGILAMAWPAFAGPLTGAPAIKFEPATEAGAATPAWAVGLGYTTFSFDFRQDFGGKSYGEDWSQSGPIISGEYTKALAGEAQRSLTFGGWIAPVGSTSKNGVTYDSMTMGELHARYGFTPNLGVELGFLVFDADDLGKTLLHVVYQTQGTGEKPVKGQFGLGVLTGSTIEDSGVTLGKWKTGLSAYANVSKPFGASYNGYLSLWLLSQKFDWDDAAIGAPGIPDLSSTTVQWSLGVSRSF